MWEIRKDYVEGNQVPGSTHNPGPGQRNQTERVPYSAGLIIATTLIILAIVLVLLSCATLIGPASSHNATEPCLSDVVLAQSDHVTVRLGRTPCTTRIIVFPVFNRGSPYTEYSRNRPDLLPLAQEKGKG